MEEAAVGEAEEDGGGSARRDRWGLRKYVSALIAGRPFLINTRYLASRQNAPDAARS